MVNQIEFKAGFKYQLYAPYKIKTALKPEKNIVTRFIHLETDGTLFIKAGYAWDGPSGPTIDSSNFLRGSLVHDVLYQLMRMGLLHESHREYSDQLLRDICREDGMSTFRSWYVYRSVRRMAASAADPSNVKPIRYAPSKVPGS